MATSLLPSFDLADTVRETAFALLWRDRRPVTGATLAAAIGLPPAEAERIVVGLAKAGWLDRDATGEITGSAGLSLTTGPHVLSRAAAEFRTWCAYDALGIAAATGVDATLSTACGQCSTPMRVSLVGGLPEPDQPARLWLAERGDDLRSSFCAPTVLLCTPWHGALWGTAHGQRGELLDLEAACRRGAVDWAGCAAAAVRLA